MPVVTKPALVQGILVIEVLTLQINRAQEGIVECLFVQVRILGIVIGQVQLVLEEDFTATGAGFAISIMAQRVIGTESFGRLAATYSAGDIVFAVDNVVPE